MFLNGESCAERRVCGNQIERGKIDRDCRLRAIGPASTGFHLAFAKPCSTFPRKAIVPVLPRLFELHRLEIAGGKHGKEHGVEHAIANDG